MSVMDEDCDGRPHFAITEDNVNIVKKLVLQDLHSQTVLKLT